MTLLKNHWKLLTGPLIYLFFLLFPLQDKQQLLTLCFSALIIFWWMTEAIPVAITSLLIPCYFFFLGVDTFENLLANFAHPLIFLFMGSFFMAKAMERTKLDQRLALAIINHPFIKGHSRRTLLSLITTTAFLSMWISNTATAAIMIGISLGIIKELKGLTPKGQSFFIMAIAYAANIGGVATKIGSTPNILANGLLQKLAHQEINFLLWMMRAAPVVIMMMAGLLILTFLANKDLPVYQELQSIVEKKKALGKMNKNEWATLFILSLVLIGWLTPGTVELIFGHQAPLSIALKKILPESLVAVLGPTLFFILPAKNNRPVLSWTDGHDIDWGTLLLFGGGLCLGHAWDKSHFLHSISTLIDNQSSGSFPLSFIFIILSTMTVFLSEILSNTACANIIIPIVIEWSRLENIDPVIPTMAVTFAASLAFILPIGTPPNAMAYGTGKVDRTQMYKLGLIMNLLSIAAISFFILCFK